MGILCKVNSCCCGATLRTGSLIIAIIEAIGIGLFLLSSAILVIALDSLPAGDLFLEGELVLSAADRETLRNVSIAAAVINGILLIANFSLLFGIVKLRHSFFVPWFICEALMLITNIVTSIMILVFSFGIVNPVNIAFNIFYLIAFTALRIYFIIVVYSYYCTIKEQKTDTNFQPR